MIGRMIRDLRTVKQLLTAAEVEARTAGDERPGPEHLVLAALGLPDGTAAQAFAAVGTDETAFRGALERVHREALQAVGVVLPDSTPERPASSGTGAYRSTPQGELTFSRATILARQSRPRGFRGAHVVAAALEDLGPGTLGRAIEVLGISPEALRDAALAIR